MTIAATCAVSEVSRSPSYYRAEQYDSDLGLYYLRARYYNAATGRFMSRDPEDGCLWHPDSQHKYLYASDDPVDRVDPSGRSDAAEEEGIIGNIDLQAVGRPTVPKGTFLGGIGLTGFGLEIACMYYTEGAGVAVAGQNIGSPQSLQLLPAICSAISGRGRGVGPEPGPGLDPGPAPVPRTIPAPPPPKRGCTCTCRADADDTMPGNIIPGQPRFAFGTATAGNCSEASKEAKRIATRNLGMKPKHIPCKCTED